jgi:hypothetical protein
LEARSGEYRPLVASRRDPIRMRLHVGLRPDGKRVATHLSVHERDVSHEDLRELEGLTWHLSPIRDLDSNAVQISQPATKWTFSKDVVLACLETERRKTPEEWLEEAGGEERDPILFAKALAVRKARRGVFMQEKDRPVSEAGWVYKPKKALYLFRGKERPTPGRRIAAGASVFATTGREAERARSRPRSFPGQRGKSNAVRLDLPESSKLARLGYRIGGLSRAARWRVLTEEAIPRLGLKKVVRTIASHRRNRLMQSYGAERYAHALDEWAYDLEHLKREIYDLGRYDFDWPASG